MCCECEEKLIRVAGYECPANISRQTKRMLRRLKRDGVLMFRHDDGIAAVTRHELVEIAGAIGIDYFEGHYEIVLIDNDKFLVDGATNVKDTDYPD